MSEWVSVVERRPEPGEVVFVAERNDASGKLDVTVGARSKWSPEPYEWKDLLDIDRNGDAATIYNPEYWMPLPKPPL